MHPRLTRRTFLTSAIIGSTLLTGRLRADTPALPPVRAITKGPKFHWFGYYDKLQFDPSSRFVLGMEVDFEGRSPTADDTLRLGVIDTAERDSWTELGTSSAWGWQQGCMLQWRPGSKTEVLWNDRDGDRFVCRIHDVKTRKTRTVPSPIYALSPDGSSAISTDFRRLNEVRPGYGYAGIADPNRDELRPKDAGIWAIDLATGKDRLILSIADVAKFGEMPADTQGAKHWFNHLLYNPDGSRFVFLHRWRPAGVVGSFRTRMLTATAEGKDLRVLDPSGNTSHFIWRDTEHLLAWTKPDGKANGFWLFSDSGGERAGEPVLVGKDIMTENGHCTFLPGNGWILNDTYPDKERLQHPYLYHVKTGRRVPLGHFRSPKEYAGEWRCDTHPRFSPDGTKVVIDSPHEGGRQMYLIDVSEVVKG